MASTVFCNYLIRLHHDPDELQRFKKDPDARATLAGLSKEQSDALKSKNATAIHEELCAAEGIPTTGKPAMNNVQMSTLVGEL